MISFFLINQCDSNFDRLWAPPKCSLLLIIIGRWLVLLIVNGTLVIVIDIVGNTFSVIVALLDVDCKCEDVINEPLVQA